MGLRDFWRRSAHALKRETCVMYLAYRDPRTPWYAKAIILCVIAYALSPIDLIPDPIPILGHLDDLILIPLGLAVARRLIPDPVLAEARQTADAKPLSFHLPGRWVVGCTVIVLWAIVAIFIANFVWHTLTRMPSTV